METCGICNNLFEKTKDRIFFCSHRCQAKHAIKIANKFKSPKKKTGKTFQCLICAKSFYAPQFRVKKGKVKYCSRSCLAKDLLPKHVKIHGFQKSKRPKKKYKQIVFNGRLTRLHRAVMEYYLGRKLSKEEHVHHIDGNPDNNHISNLIILSNSDHGKISWEERQLLEKKLPEPVF